MKPGLNAPKYKAKPTVYNGIRFDSKAEAHRAMELDVLLKAGQLVEVIYQPKFRLGVSENVYVADFLVMQKLSMHPDAIKKLGVTSDLIFGDVMIAWAEDTKGFETPKFRRDKVLWKRYGRLPLVIRKGGKEVERIEPDGKTS